MTEAVRLITKPELEQKYQAVELLATMVRNGGFYQSLASCRRNLERHKKRREEDYGSLCILSRQSNSFQDYRRYFDDTDAPAQKFHQTMLEDWLQENPKVETHPAYKHVFTAKQQTFLTLLTKGVGEISPEERVSPEYWRRSLGFRAACGEATGQRHPLIGELRNATNHHGSTLFNAEMFVSDYETTRVYPKQFKTAGAVEYAGSYP